MYAANVNRSQLVCQRASLSAAPFSANITEFQLYKNHITSKKQKKVFTTTGVNICFSFVLSALHQTLAIMLKNVGLRQNIFASTLLQGVYFITIFCHVDKIASVSYVFGVVLSRFPRMM